MKLSDLTKGCQVHADAGFTCLSEGAHIVDIDADGAFIPCNEGKHYLEGQEDEHGELIGIAAIEVRPYGYRVLKSALRG